LEAEVAITAEASLEQKLGAGLTATITGFQNETTNLIEFDGASSRYYNINRALIKGLESSVEWELSGNLSSSVQYTHLATLDRQSNEPLPSRPDESWSGDVTWTQDGFSWMTAVRGQTRSRARPYVDGTEGFRVVDNSVAWRQGPLRYALKVNNLLNSWYQEVAGYNTAARQVHGSLEYKF
jgi:vitamin B12 transporter